jgi:Family of unknown function (DUF5681)
VTEPTDNATAKQRGRPWPKGISGNPAGCRTGSRHRATVLLEQLMAGDAEAVVRAVVEKAKGGDMTAARIIIDRLIPPRKGRPVRLDLPAIRAAGDLLAAQSALIQALAEGEVTAEEAAAVSSVLEANRKMIETEELATRLQRLEERVGAGR